MATTFNWIHLGTSSTSLDPTEGNTTMENAGSFVGQTYGTAANPLYQHVTSATMSDKGGTAGVMDTNNTLSNDTFTTNLGGGTATYTLDGVAEYKMTVSYTDGTSGTITGVMVQDTAGNLYLAPEFTANSDVAVMEAKPIQSVTLNSVTASNVSGLTADRIVTGFDDGIIDGTSGGDLINGSYVEPTAKGTDKVDNNDGLSSSGSNADSIRAGAGDDSVYANLGNDTVDAGDGNDLVYGGDGDDLLKGAAGADQIYGGNNADLIYGGDGNDLLQGDAGNDTLDGGANDDSLYGGEGNDSLLGADGNDQLFGGNGDDTLSGGAGADTLDSGGGNDLFYGGSDSDLVYGGSGLDTIFGGSEADVVYAGDNEDQVFGDAGNDTLYGGNGNDLVSGGDGDDNADGGAGNDTVDGGAGNDVVSGGDGNDKVVGGTGNDSLGGGAGDDSLSGDDGNDSVDGGAGNDSLFGGTGNDSLGGGAGDDSLSGDNGNDSLDGGTGNDSLYGGTGDDTLKGGAGNELLSGGDGHDHFVVEVGGGADAIVDFSISIPAGSSLTDGAQTMDQLDLSDLSNKDGTPIKSFDVDVSDDGKGNALLTFPGGETLVLQGVSPASLAAPGMMAAMGVPCFAQGSLIDTPDGAVPVESLSPGDLVLTGAGAQRVLWTGQRLLDAEALALRPDLRPIRLRAGHFGLTCDLLVSPQHGIQVGDALIRARHLALNAGGAHVAQGVRGVRYHHILLPCHAVLSVQGARAESFYPGSEALRGLLWADRIAVAALVLGAQNRRGGVRIPRQSLQQVYGPRILPLMCAKQARLALVLPLQDQITIPA